MHDSEFEKQVQQKMQELRFAPGADVWTRVQADMRKKKRRRPVLLWVLLAGLLIGSSWFLYREVLDNRKVESTDKLDIMKSTDKMDNTDGTDKAIKTDNPDNTDNIDKSINPDNTDDSDKSNVSVNPTNNDQSNNDQSNDQSNNDDKSNDVNKPVNSTETNKSINPNKTIDLNKKIDPDKTIEASKSTKPKNDKNNIAVSDNTINANKTDKSNKLTEPDNTVKSNKLIKTDNTVKSNNTDKPINKSADQPVISKPVQPDASSAIVSKQPDTKQKDNITKQTNDLIVKDPEPSKDSLQLTATEKPSAPQSQPQATDPANNTAIAMKNTAVKKSPDNKKWEWGITAGAGISDLGNQLFQNTSVADFAFSPSTGSGVPSTIRRPSALKAGTAFQIGGYALREMSTKLKLKLGLNYEYFSNSIRVGSHIDNARVINQGTDMKVVESYYIPGSTNKFTNSYHFISLPITLQWKLNNQQKWGLIWENGFIPARLISSDALHYDGIGGTYYKDKDVFKKMQWMVSSSLLFSIKTKNNLQLYAGPHVQYGLSNLVNNDSQNEKHLRYAGLKLAIGFNKK